MPKKISRPCFQALCPHATVLWVFLQGYYFVSGTGNVSDMVYIENTTYCVLDFEQFKYFLAINTQ
jgi:bacteriorhodopsin